MPFLRYRVAVCFSESVSRAVIKYDSAVKAYTIFCFPLEFGNGRMVTALFYYFFTLLSKLGFFCLSVKMLSKLANSLKPMGPDGVMRENIAKNGLVWLQKNAMLSKLKTISQKEQIYLNSFVCKMLHHRNIILFGHV